jgi:cobalamin-dependent methionine synthase I
MHQTELDSTPYVLDEIAYEPNRTALAKRLRLREGRAHLEEFEQVCDAVADVARPKALYKLAYIEDKQPDAVVIDGVTLKSRVLRVNLDVAHRAIAYVATCGIELQAWGESLDDMLHQYWADAIKEAALRAAIRALTTHLNTCYEMGPTAVMSPGSLADWPIREQRPLFNILGDPEQAIGVTLTESFLMIPNKSVSGLRFPTEERFESCQLCPRDNCPGRRAAYEPDLYNRKYRLSE